MYVSVEWREEKAKKELMSFGPVYNIIVFSTILIDQKLVFILVNWVGFWLYKFITA